MDSHDAIVESEQTRSLRAPSSEPLLTHRDVSGDSKNRSPSRKRPRLDSGSRIARSMSADQALSSLDKAAGVDHDSTMQIDSRAATPNSDGTPTMKPVLTPSRVTINVREHPKGGTIPGTNGRRGSSSSSSLKAANGVNGHTKPKDSSTSSSTSPQSASSPIIQVAAPDSEEGDGVVTDIQLDDESDEDRIASLFYHFPYSMAGNYCEAAELIAEEQEKALNFDILLHLDKWLQDLQRCIRQGSNEWTRVFYEHGTFWEVIAKIYLRMFNRNVLKHTTQPSADVVENFARTFLHTFANLLARILQVDAILLTNNEAIEAERLSLLSLKLVNVGKSLLREERGFLAKVVPLFGVDEFELRAYFIKCLVQADGPRYLAQMIKLNLDDAYRNETFLQKVIGFIQFAQSLGAYAAFYLTRQEGLPHPLADSLATTLLDVFESANKQLLSSLDKQQDLLNLDNRKNIFEFLSSILASVFALAPQRSEDIFSHITGRKDTEFKDFYRHLAITIWKLKLMWAYMTKGRMDLRLLGIDVMQKELVEFFTAYKEKEHSLRTGNPGPLLSFVAQFLLDEQITEYLFGVASHPQLINRSSNVIGFLIVTNNFSKHQATLMYRTVKDSQDPRVVAASLPILANLIKTLTIFEENVMISEIVMSESLPLISTQASEFLLELLGKLRQQYQEYHFHALEKTDRLYHLPLELCIELIRVLSPTLPQTTHTQLVYDHACEVLAALAPLSPPDVRKALFEKCIGNMKNSFEDGAASAQGLHHMLRQARVVPKILADELSLVPVLMEDFCKFVSAKRSADVRFTMPQLNLQIWPRLDLIWSVVPTDEEGIDEQLVKRFWGHVVGSEAISNAARDVAWHRLSMITFNPGVDNGFLEQHEELLSPTQIEPRFFTSGFFSFIQKLATSKMRAQAMPELNEDGTINIPGLDLIWDAILRAPKNVGEDNTLQYLISRYLDDLWLQRTSKKAVEATHVALVNASISRLRQAYDTIRGTGADSVSEIDSETGMLTPTHSREEAELSFMRTMKFLKKFLLHVRTLKEHRSSSNEVIDIMEDAEPPTYRGNLLSIKCEIIRQGQRTISRVLNVGSLDTCRQLYRRICSLLGEYNVVSFQLIGSGKRIYLREHPRLTLEEAGIARAQHLILREGASGDEARKDYIIPSQHWRSAFEQQLVNGLDVFYSFLDGTDVVSSITFDLLKHLPRYQALKEIVSKDDAAVADLFPFSQPCKTGYSLDCLRELLETSPADDAFIARGTRILESLLPNDEALADLSKLNPELLADAVSCLYDFFAAGQGKNLDMFADVTSVMRRILTLCVLAVPWAKGGSLAWDSYELAIDLLSNYEAAWQEFTSNPQAANVHEHLLFGHPDIVVRRTASQLIQRRLTQWPAGSCITLPTFGVFLWSIVINLIPRIALTQQRAAETFEVTNFLYKTLLALQVLTHEQVTALFNSWSPMLASHIHHEIVGRDEVDIVLRGLAVLLRLTLEAVPNIVSTSEKIDLMKTIWWKFLFQQDPRTSEDVARLAQQLPVLESDTRTELVKLLSILSTETETVEALCDLLGDVKIEHKFNSQVDKIGLLRSPAGYVGLKNLGQTCYMNSLMTQLFMNPVFRAFILSSAPLTQGAQSPLLHETQRLFAIMQNSYHGYASAADFTKKIVTLTEEVIDVREQMDVDEFMNTLFHRWEEQMPSVDLKGRLRSVYTGKTVQQIKSKECEHVSEREDTCLAIPCDVQGNANLEESLKAYVQGDVMEGDNKYKCERCDRLVDAVKRTCLKDIPDHLMLQLKRFAFDLETYSRNKINDHFGFPMTIDMSPYTFDHLANPDEPIDEDIFDLVGVIVHKGQAEHGHYVSYIRARPTPEGEAPTWLLFDDSDVTIFDPKDFPEACFGGFANKDTSLLFQSGLKSYNAYMLFYQRRSSLQQHPWVVDGSMNLQSVPIAADMEEEITGENRILLRDYSLFDDSSRELIRILLGKLECLDHTALVHQTQSKLLDLVWKYLSSVWARTKDLPYFEEAMDQLRSICLKCSQCCYISIRWLIASRRKSWNMVDDEDILRDLILKISQPKVRQIIRSFIVAAMMKMRTNADMYGADITYDEPDLRGNGALSIVTRLAQFIPDYLHYNFRAWDDFFGLLADLAALGAQEGYALILDGALTACFEAMLCSTGYGGSLDSKYRWVNESLKRKMGPSHNQVIRLASILFNYVHMRLDAIPEAETNHRLEFFVVGGLPWTDNEERLLLDFNKKEGGLIWLCEVFHKWNFETEGFTFAPGEIVRTLLTGKSAVVHGVVETFLTTIKDFETRYADPFLRSAQLIPRYVTQRELLEKFIKFMRQCSREANGTTSRGDDGYNGYYCFRFWSAVHQMGMGKLETRLNDQIFFDKQFITYSREWAPTLLAYTKDWEVGRTTQRLLQEAIFKAWSQLVDEDVRDLNEQETIVLHLFWGCDRQVRIWQAGRDEPWRQFMAPLITVMHECVEFIKEMADGAGDEDPESIADDEKVFSRFDELKTWFETLPSRTDDDLELAQSSELNTAEWEGLDLAEDGFAETSDLTEVSDDDGLGAMLTTDLEG